MRYSLRTLGAIVTGIAISCAALLKANPWVSSTAWTLMFVMLSLATVAAVLSTRDRRGFWTGFAIVGWLYLLVGIGPFSGYHNGSLLTTTALHRAARLLPQRDPQADAVVTGVGTTGDATLTGRIIMASQTDLSTIWFGNPGLPSMTEPAQSFVQVGQVIWTLLLALLGGWFGGFFCRSSPK